MLHHGCKRSLKCFFYKTVMNIEQQIKEAIADLADKDKAPILQRYFKTGKGQYAEGDVFVGVKVPDQRQVARHFYKSASLKEVEVLLQSHIHEHRLTALFILVLQFQKAKDERPKKTIVDLYLDNLPHVNNWDLVDSSAPYILGAYLYNKPRQLLYDFAKSGQLWTQRISIVATYYFIRKNDFKDTLAIAEILLHHPHDLIHKATGWMLREIGNRDADVAIDFLTRHYHHMPRTMLRYAIEKLDQQLRQQFLKGTV